MGRAAHPRRVVRAVLCEGKPAKILAVTFRAPRLPALLASCVLTLQLGLGGCSSSPPPPGFGSGLPRVEASAAIEREERAMLQRLNRDRAAQGLPPLTYDSRLADVARYHSADMRDNRFFEHDSPNSGSLEDRLDAAGYAFLAARENLSEAPDVERGQDGLLRSPPHHANIMADDVTHVGIGIVSGGVHAAENLTITQVFARPGKVESAAEARANMSKVIQAARRAAGLPPAQSSPLLEELAREHVAALARDPGALATIADRVTEVVSQRRERDLAGVAVGAQRLADSSALEVPSSLRQDPRASFGLAVEPTQDERGRPRLQVLLLVGLHGR